MVCVSQTSNSPSGVRTYSWPIESDRFSVNYYALNENNSGTNWCLRQRNAALNSSQYSKALAYNFLTNANLDGAVDLAKQEIFEKEYYYLMHFYNAWFTNNDGQYTSELDKKDKQYEIMARVDSTLEHVSDYADFATFVNETYPDWLELGDDDSPLDEFGIGTSTIKSIADRILDYNEYTAVFGHLSSINGSEKSFKAVLNLLTENLAYPNGLPNHAAGALEKIEDTYDSSAEKFSHEALSNTLTDKYLQTQVGEIAGQGILKIFDWISDKFEFSKSPVFATVQAVHAAQDFGKFTCNKLFGTDQYVEQLFNIVNLGDILLCLQSVLQYTKDLYKQDTTNADYARLVNTAYKMTLSFLYYTYDYCEQYLEAAYKADTVEWIKTFFGASDLDAQIDDLQMEKRDQ